MSIFISHDTLSFDLYGDITFDNGDIVVNRGAKATLQIMADYLKTNSGDYLFYQQYGAGYDQYIGKGITIGLVNQIANKIEKDLLALELVTEKVLEVRALQTGTNSIEVRINLYGVEENTIYMFMDKNEGTLIDY